MDKNTPLKIVRITIEKGDEKIYFFIQQSTLEQFIQEEVVDYKSIDAKTGELFIFKKEPI